MGWTVACIAILNDHLSKSFDRWTLRNTDIFGREDEYTLAHVAASLGWLPDDFFLWDLTNENGVTVAQVALDQQLNTSPLIKYLSSIDFIKFLAN
jgi:hypothetical protein